MDQTGAYQPPPDTIPAATGPAASWPDFPGYAITGEIARGGMGRVLAGRELMLDREVAIKVLLPGADGRRFVTESKITAKLPHPNIPPVYTLGTLADGSPFLAMKLIRGRTLAEELKLRSDVTTDLPRFIQIFEQIAQAVGYAHAHGVVHRDLKPANVMVGEFGEVQVMDWGLAKRVANAPASRHATSTRDDRGSAGSESPDEILPATDDRYFENFERTNPYSPPFGPTDGTVAGTVMGTPAYMAPEQARGEPTDATADVFALGGILTSILTGRAVFRSDSPAKAIQMAAACETTEVVAQLAACGADSELVSVALACLKPDRTDRPASGSVVAQMVTAYRQRVEQRLRAVEAERAAVVAREVEGRKRRLVIGWSAGALAVVLVAGVVGTTLGMFEARQQEESARTQEAEAKRQALLAQDEATAKEAAKSVAERRLLGQLNERAVRRLNDGNLFGAMFLFAETLPLLRQDHNAAALQRQRLAEIAAQLPELRSLLVGGPVSSIEWSKDGRSLLVASDDRTVRMWTTADSQPAWTFIAKDRVVAAALSPDGTRVFAGDARGNLMLLDAATGKEVVPPFALKVTPTRGNFPLRFLWLGFRVGSDELITAASFDFDETEVVRRRGVDGSQIGTAAVVKCDIASASQSPDGSTLLIFAGNILPSNRVFEFDLSQDTLQGTEFNDPKLGKRFVSKGLHAPDGELYLVIRDQLESLRYLYLLVPAGKALPAKPINSTEQPTSITFSPDNKVVALGSSTGRVRVWKRGPSDGIAASIDHSRAVTTMAFSPDGKQLATAGEDQEVNVWHIAAGSSALVRGRVIAPLRHSRVVRHVRFSPDGRYLLTADDDGVLRLWDLAGVTQPEVVISRSGFVTPESFTTGRVVHVGEGVPSAFGGKGDPAQVFELSTGKPVGGVVYLKGISIPTSAVISPDGKWAAGPIENGSKTDVWNAETGKLAARLDHKLPMKSLTFSADSRSLVVSGVREFQFWTVPTGVPMRGTYHGSSLVDSVALSPDGKYVASYSATNDGAVRVFLTPAHLPNDIPTKDVPPVAFVAGERASTVKFSPDSRWLATGGKDGQVRVWDCTDRDSGNTSRPAEWVLPHHSKVIRLEFSRDSTLLLSATQDGAARVWDLHSGKPVTQPMWHDAQVNYVAFNDDATRVVTASSDSSARVWETATGWPITPPLRTRSPVRYAAFQGTDHVLTATDGAVMRWKLHPDDRSTEWWSVRTRVLAGVTTDEHGIEVPLSKDTLSKLWLEMSLPPLHTPK